MNSVLEPCLISGGMRVKRRPSAITEDDRGVVNQVQPN